MFADNQPPINFSDQELDYLRRMQFDHNHYINMNSLQSFDVLRWCHAYNGDLETASRKMKRHQMIRKILKLDQINNPNGGYEIDTLAEDYAPLTYLGNTSETVESAQSAYSTAEQMCSVFLEQSGQFDLAGIMNKVRLTPFMMNRFKQMEQILNSIKLIEQLTMRMSGAILIIDLKGLNIELNMVKFISSTYRIMWGTLMEQYPFIFTKFLIINAPSFMNLLWSACSTFIPAEYREKVILLNTSDDYSALHKHINPCVLPIEYGGQNLIQLKTPSKCDVSLIKMSDKIQLNLIFIPAGKYLIKTYYLVQGQELEFYLLNSQEITLNMFYSPDKKVNIAYFMPYALQNVTDLNKEIHELEEVYAGCERPGLPTIDMWAWIAPYSGFYHVVFGNEKAWWMNVKIEYQLFEVHVNGSKVKVNSIPN